MGLERDVNKVCIHVIAVYSDNKLKVYTTAYRHQKSSGEKLCIFSAKTLNREHNVKTLLTLDSERYTTNFDIGRKLGQCCI